MAGCFSEEEMNAAYNACHAYVSTSRGEGWDLPVQEAASAGLPVIAPNAFAHLDFLSEGNSSLFQPHGFAPYPGAESVSPWYEGMDFPVYDAASRRELTELFLSVKHEYAKAVEKGVNLTELVREKYTWNHTAERVTNRLTDIVEA
jgi:glycosyltransferase involved in cell wall biosynthesis